MATFLIFVVFVVLTSDSLIFHCFFFDDSLMTLWRTIDDTTNIWTQMFLISKAFNVLYFNFWCFIAAWLISRCWWFFEETMLRFDDFDANNNDKLFFGVVISETLMFYCCFVDDRSWCFGEIYWKQWQFRWNFFWSLLFGICQTLKHWSFIVSSLMIRWWLFEETLLTLRRFWCKQWWS